MVSRVGALLPILSVLSGCCLEVVSGQGSGGITDATTGGPPSTTGGATSGSTSGGTSSRDSGPPAACPQAGACVSDSDCVVAYCASEPCGGCDHFAVSKTLLSQDACLTEIGPVDGPTGPASSACKDVSTVGCGCFAHPYCVPLCSAGTCACEDAGSEVGCAGVYCAPNYQCNPVDGVCRCGGQDCEGDCEPDSGTCLATCDPDAGDAPHPILGTSAYAVWLPTAVVDSNYLYQLKPNCDSSQFVSIWSGRLPRGLNLNLIPNGVIAGKPLEVSDGGPFELEVWVTDGRGDFGTQNYLIEVVARDGGT